MTNKFKLEWFEDKESHDAFMMVAKAAEKLIEISKAKDIVFMDEDNEEWNVDRIRIIVAEKESEVMIGSLVIAGSTHDEAGRIYMDMEETKDMLNRFQVYERVKVDWLN